MSGVKRKKSRSVNLQKGLEIVFRDGFHRIIIKSEENGRNIGVYYVTRDGEFLKNINDVIDWLDKNEKSGSLNRSNFNFISKKLTENNEFEYFICQSNLPNELLDYMLEKKKSIAPGIIGVYDNSNHSSLSNDKDEPLEKKVKTDEIIQSSHLIEDENNLNVPLLKINEELDLSINDDKLEDTLLAVELVQKTDLLTTDYEKETENEFIIKKEKTILNEQEIILLSEDEQEIISSSKEELVLDKDTVESVSETTQQEQETLTSTEEGKQETPSSSSEQEQQIPLSITDQEKDIPSSITEQDQEISLTNKPKPEIPSFEIKSTEEISLDNCISKPIKEYEYPMIPMNDQYIFETGQLCHKERLMEYLNVEFHEVMKDFRPYCNHLCAFDINGLPRVTFECDICLVLWHTDCIGYRWLSIEAIKLIICDNCYLLQKTINILYPNLFCDIQMLFLQESKPENNKNPENKTQLKIEPIFKLYRIHNLMNKYSNNNGKKVKSDKKTTKKDSNSIQRPKWKYFVQIQINQENIMRELKEEYICLKYGLDNIDRFSKIFSDPECQLLIDDKPCEIISSRITIKKGEIVIPVRNRIVKSCTGIFYTVDRNQDERVYLSRCEDFKSALVNGFYSKHELIPQSADNKALTVLKDVSGRKIHFTPIVPVSSIGNRFKIISSNCLFLPRANALTTSQSILRPNAIPPINATTLSNMVKIRQRKQDFGNQKGPMKTESYMKNKQFNFLNLPFSVLEQILSSSILTTQDKLNCRLSNRILKCIIDGSQVWQKLVINPNSITGLENMLNFFRMKIVKKITFHIDFQESFGMEFLFSFISRLKMYPDYMSLEKFSIKFNGFVVILAPIQLSVHDILSSCKSLKNLSISSEYPLSLAISKKKLTSNSIEKLKLKNIQNVYSVIQSNEGLTPNLRKLYSGDWSFVSNIECIPFNQITHMAMYFSQLITMSDMSGISMLTNLEVLSISRPIINEDLMNLLICILRSKQLSKFSLKTLVPSKNSFDSCYKLSCCFPKTIPTILWKLDFEDSKMTDEAFIKSLIQQIQEILTKNVQLVY